MWVRYVPAALVINHMSPNVWCSEPVTSLNTVFQLCHVFCCFCFVYLRMSGYRVITQNINYIHMFKAIAQYSEICPTELLQFYKIIYFVNLFYCSFEWYSNVLSHSVKSAHAWWCNRKIIVRLCIWTWVNPPAKTRGLSSRTFAQNHTSNDYLNISISRK